MRKRAVLHSQRLTPSHEFYDTFSKMAALFGYEAIPSESRSDTQKLIMEGGEMLLFCDEELYYALMSEKVASRREKGWHTGVILIGEGEAAVDQEVDGYLPLNCQSQAASSTFERTLFNIYKYEAMNERFRTLSGRTDPSLVSMLLVKTTHAINNILTGMQGYSELAQMHSDDRKLVRDSFEVVLESSQRIKNEIHRLRAFARMESPKRDHISMVQVLDEAVRLAASRSGTNMVKFDAQLYQDFLVDADYDQLVQVFYFLFAEIAGFCTEGGVVSLSISSIDTTAVVTIRCARCLQDEETIRHVRRLMSLDIPILETEGPEGRDESHSVLTICGRIIRNHKGEISLREDGKNGILIRVKLPVLKRLADLGEAKKASGVAAPELADVLDMDILVVDDEEYIRNTLYYFFIRKGCRVTLAEDGEFGLRVAAKQQFDLIFMDYLMPRMGGIEACKRISAMNGDVKIVIITGKESLDEKELQDAGVYDCIRKPFEIRELYAIARKVAMERRIIG
ncbi:MAG: response regulator [Spirochaetes bacterium]|nr:response regulator [Spirochaetota bacterium]